MPQMSPMWWEILFLLFISFYIMMNIMLYFNKKNNSIKNNKNMMKHNKQINWKW
uniref:ATP synthase F0 subunit 8 n=1 Tax=Piezodorus guildinii TaxID=437484 RepID=UPI002047FF92|nr:ATP synthase F0 subunit 8 [Piezodorus guildinii]WGT93131.1 ATP synthase F0 subunit 8 [Piezodorus guildinii]DAZ87550.1 TPA_asm: ATP synthase F0 subunit 8 [Piezodorus guildinii]